MAGREKIKVYEYELRGKLFKIHNSLVECCEDLFGTDGTNRPIFQYKDFYLSNRNTILFKEKKRRDEVFFIVEKEKNPMILSNEDKKIELVNMENEVIATFANIKICSLITGDLIGTILNSINYRKTNSIPKNKYRTYYRYCL